MSSILNPGDGNTFADDAGNVYSLTADDSAVENGSPILTGYGTAQMEFSSGTVYGQDVNSGQWFTWDQQYWTPSAAPGDISSGSAPMLTSDATPPAAPTSSSDTMSPAAPTSSSDTTSAAAPAAAPSSGTIPVITPGNGTFSDSSGNVYSISVDEMAMINGGPIAGADGADISSGTIEMAYDQGQVYGEDSTSWYVLSPKNAGPNTWEWHQATPPDLASFQS